MKGYEFLLYEEHQNPLYENVFFVSLSSTSSSVFFFKYITLFVKKIPRAVIAPSIVNNAAKKTFHTLPHPPNTVTCDTLILYHNDIKGEK